MATNPSKKKKPLLYVIASIFIICILCTVVSFIYSQTPAGKASAATSTAKAISSASITETNIQKDNLIATATISITSTPIPTNTATTTLTPKPTNTTIPTNTITPTLPSPEQTGTAVAFSRTEIANQLTATQEAKYFIATSTQAAKIATATEVAKYKEIDWRELSTYADDHIGELVIVRGRVFNVINNTDFQIYFSGTYEAAYISMLDPYTGLYEDSSVIVYGIVAGKACGTNAFGGEICQPQIMGTFFGK